MKAGLFLDAYRGNGVFVSAGRFLVAVRGRWHFYHTRVFNKPGYRRWYIGPVEIEIRAARAAAKGDV